MAHIHHLARRRPTARFFGTECQIADMAHEAIERQRIDDENALLRNENANLRLALSESEAKIVVLKGHVEMYRSTAKFL